MSMNRRQWLSMMIAAPVGICFTLYCGGIIAQFLINYAAWEKQGGFSIGGNGAALPSAQIADCLQAVAHFPEGIYGVLIFIGLIIVVVIMILHLGRSSDGAYDKERNLTYSTEGTYGTSGFMNEAEMKKVLLVQPVEKTTGTILGKLGNKPISVPIESRMNRNIAVYGASGSMKSRAFARCMAFQIVKRGESIVITDPKSELYEDLSQFFRDEGYCVKVFNLVNPSHSDSWNCLKEIGGDEIMAQVFCDVIIKNTGSAKGDHFWDNAELNLLKALVLYVEQTYVEEQKAFGQVYQLLTMKDETALNKLFDLLPSSHPARPPYSIFRQASDTVRTGVIIGLGSRLQVFQNELIRKITSYDEIDLTRPGREKCAFFCITSDQDSTFDFLSSLFLTFLFIKLVRYADAHGKDGKLPVHVHILADELANVGVIPDLCKKISTIRSRSLSMSCIFQNVPQMQNRYPDNQWLEIIGNCDVQLFLGCTDEVTAQFISDRSGEVSVGLASTVKQLNSWRVSNYTADYRETSSVGKRKLLTMDEVLRLPIDKELIILRGQKILKADKFDYTLHPYSERLVKSKAIEYIPDWKKEEDKQVLNSKQICGFDDTASKGSFFCTDQKGSLSKASVLDAEEKFVSMKEKSQKPKPEKQSEVVAEYPEQHSEGGPPVKKITKADKDSIMS